MGGVRRRISTLWAPTTIKHWKLTKCIREKSMLGHRSRLKTIPKAIETYRPFGDHLEPHPLNPQLRRWRSGNHHCLKPVTRSPKSRVGSNPRDALFRNSTTEISATRSHERPNPVKNYVKCTKIYRNSNTEISNASSKTSCIML